MSQALESRLLRNLRLIGAVRLLFSFHLVSAVLIPFFRDWGGLDYTRILALNAWFMAWVFVLEIPTGSVADRYGRKASMLLGGIVSAVGTLIMVAAPRYEVFLLAEVLLALGVALMSGADQALLYDTLVALGQEDRAARAFARLESLKLVGITLGAVCGSPIAEHLGLPVPIALQALPFGLSFLLAASLYEVPQHGVATRAQGEGPLLLAGIRALRKSSVLRALATDSIATHALVFLIIWLYQPLLEGAGVALSWFGTVHAGLALGQILVLSRLADLEQVFGSPLRYLRVSAFLPGLAFLALGATRDPWLVIACVIAAGAFGLTRSPILVSHMNKHIESRERATVLSTVTGLRTLAMAAVHLLAGVLMDWSLPGTLWVLGGLLLLAGGLAGARASDLR